ncbi:flippase [Ancylobacter lacus]|uniref:flippase n=1 Tax=Ancylobacter lacus TaxID=2579970 RepID=UPI001BCD1AF7|nr:flippase [Ancylobacter lacus]
MAASIWQLSNYLIPLVTFPYLARVLGVEGFGLVGLATSIMAYALLVTDWGFALTATQAVARHKDDKAAISRIIWSTVAAKFLLAVVCAICVAGVAIFGAADLRPVILMALVILFANVFNIDWALRGVGDLGSFASISIVGRVAAIPPLFVLVRDAGDANMAVLTTGIGGVVIAVLSQWRALRLGLIGRPSTSFGAIAEALKDGAHVFGATTVISLYTNTITVVLGMWGGPGEVGLYSAADRIKRPVYSLLSPIGLVFFPRMSTLTTTDEGAAAQMARRLLLFQGGTSFALALALTLFAPLVVRILLGAQFESVVPVLRILGWTVFMVGLSNVLGLMIMLPFGMKKAFTYCIICGAVAGTVSMFPLIYFFGAEGAAAAALISEGAVTTSMLFVLSRRFHWMRFKGFRHV